METTPNYNLKKPSYDEFADVEILNENADIIDAKLKELENEVGNNTELTQLKQQVTTHLDEKMPHKYVGSDSKTYRWGLGEDSGGIYFAREGVV